MLMQCLLEYLNDPSKCTPGLYQVIRGVVADNKENLDSIPNEVLASLEKEFTDSIPFKQEMG